MPDNIAKNYNPKEWEAEIYELWHQNQIGKPEVLSSIQKNSSSTPSVNGVGGYSILMPPPNLTGDLHTGHAFQHFLSDTLIRIARQNDKPTVWYPGTDHAGIQLEGVIDKLIRKGEFDEVLRQKEFLEGVDKEDWPMVLKKADPELWKVLAWEKVNTWKNTQEQQAKIFGDTPDYDRATFSLDPKVSELVEYAFSKYFQDGLLYKSSYLVNWSVGLQTAVADIPGETEHLNRKDPLVTFEYAPIKWTPPAAQSSSIEEIAQNPEEEILTKENVISKELQLLLYAKLKPVSDWPRLRLSTVRPETKFTDIAVAMHPSKFSQYFSLDKIFTKLTEEEKPLANEFLELIKTEKIGVYYDLPPLKSEPVKLVIDQEVLADFGTGILKITPGHDIFDYNIFTRLVSEKRLEPTEIQVCIDKQGKIKKEFSEDFGGLTLLQARAGVLKLLLETGFVSRKEGMPRQDLTDKAWEKVEFNDTASAKTPSIEKADSEQPVDQDAELSNDQFKKLDYEAQMAYLQAKYPEYEVDWDYEHNVLICERSKTIVEPLISEEYFLNLTKKPFSRPDSMQNLALKGIDQVNFFTSDYKERGKNFMENIQDWCISRDLIWGHPIPVWYNLDTNPGRSLDPNELAGLTKTSLEGGKAKSGSEEKTQNSKSSLGQTRNSTGYSLSTQYYHIGYKKPEIEGNWMRESKILDTWFSSSLWPLATTNFVEYQKNKPLAILIGGGNAFDNYQDVLENLEKMNPFEFQKSSWKENLENELTKNHFNFLKIQMPNTQNAKYAEWEIWFEKYLNHPEFVSSLTKSKEKLHLIGHSLGASFLLKYISQKKLAVKSLHLLTAPTAGIADFSSSLGDINLETVEQIYIYQSSDDSVVPEQATLEVYEFLKEKGANVNLQKYSDLGHFLGVDNIPELTQNLIEASKTDQGLVQSDFYNYFPTQILPSGKDIFYIWILRMIMLSMYFTDQIPFKDVVIHPTVLDDLGRKMSKSLNNGMDPKLAVDKFSSDALRLSMLSVMIPDRNVRLGDKIASGLMENYRNFGNKLWNISRFLESKHGSLRNFEASALNPQNLSAFDIWLYQKFVNLKVEVKAAVQIYDFSLVINKIYSFIWNDLADWYLEFSKSKPSDASFIMGLYREILIFISPYIPFEAEVIYREIFKEPGLIATEVLTPLEGIPKDLEPKIEEVEDLKDLITMIRKTKKLFGIDPVTKIVAFSRNQDLVQYSEVLGFMGKVVLDLSDGSIAGSNKKLYQISSGKFSLELDFEFEAGQIEKIKTTCQKNIASLEKQIKALETVLNNPGFTAKASAEAIEQKQADLAARKEDLANELRKLEFVG